MKPSRVARMSIVSALTAQWQGWSDCLLKLMEGSGTHLFSQHHLEELGLCRGLGLAFSYTPEGSWRDGTTEQLRAYRG